MAGETWKVQAFRDQDAGTGPDLYLLAVSHSRNLPIEKCMPYRNEGKVEELACQYEGGKGAFATWCKTYRMEMSDDEKEARKNRWRNRHPMTRSFWRAMNECAIAAVRDGHVHAYRGIRFAKQGSFLFCKLLSGRVLTYPYPRIEVGKFGGDALSYMCVNSVSRKWERHHTYGGDLTNHVTQATARDLQVNAMQQLTAAGFGIVLEVYDEIVVEAPIGALPVDTMSTIMCKLPTWAAGLPVTAEGWAGARYRK
jgi:DNA polymerase